MSNCTVSNLNSGLKFLRALNHYGYKETKVPVFEQGQKVGDISTASHYMYAGGQYLGELTEHGQIRVKQQHFKGLDVLKSENNRLHQVQEGETLRSIAQLQYGNGNFWFIIADANSLTSDPDEGLTVGQSLTIPQQNNNQNSFDTLLPMNLAELIGDTTPSLGYLPPPSEAGCNAVASIIMIAVAVAVTGGVAGASLIANGAANAAFAAAVGSVASQVAGMALGVVDKFSWKQVAVSAITAGATKGLGDKLKLKPAGDLFSHDVARGAISYGAGHAANKLLGQQTSFSWSNVAASSLGYAAGTQVGTSLAQEIGVDFSTDFGSQLTSELTSGVADLHIGRALGENTKVDYGQIGLDAFGNAIGNTIVGRMERAREQELQQQRLAQINQQHSRSSQRLQDNAAQDLNNSIAGTARRIAGEVDSSTNELVTQQGLSNNNELSTLFQGERGQKIQDNFYRSAQEVQTRTNDAIHAANLAGEQIRLEGQQLNAVRQGMRDAEIARVQTQFDALGNGGRQIDVGYSESQLNDINRDSHNQYKQSFSHKVDLAQQVVSDAYDRGEITIALGGTAGVEAGAGADFASGKFFSLNVNTGDFSFGTYRSGEFSANLGIPTPEAHAGLEFSVYPTSRYDSALQGRYTIAGADFDAKVGNLSGGLVTTNNGKLHGVQFSVQASTPNLTKLLGHSAFYRAGGGEVLSDYNFNYRFWE